MRNLEDIEKDLAAAREALSSVKGTQAEVYSRIVGYYRSVRNWNKGKREEYGERRLYLVKVDDVSGNKLSTAAASRSFQANKGACSKLPDDRKSVDAALMNETRLLLFVRASCPACPPAKAAAGRLGIPVDLVNADTADGMAEAERRNVMSTPTAILISTAGEELGRAKDAAAIGALVNPAAAIA